MRTITFLLFAVAIIIQSGCGQQFPPDWPKTYPTTITVTQDGQPYEGVTLVLTRTENHGSWAVAGITNASGIAEIETSWTHASAKGAPEGTFRVTLSKDVPFERSISDEELNAMPYDRRTAFLEAEAAHRRNNPVFPRSLADPAAARVQVEVIPGEPAAFTIEVSDYR